MVPDSVKCEIFLFMLLLDSSMTSEVGEGGCLSLLRCGLRRAGGSVRQCVPPLRPTHNSRANSNASARSNRLLPRPRYFKSLELDMNLIASSDNLFSPRDKPRRRGSRVSTERSSEMRLSRKYIFTGRPNIAHPFPHTLPAYNLNEWARYTRNCRKCPRLRFPLGRS